MTKILIKFIIIIYFFSSNVFADKINKITVQGNKRISEETIKVLGDISFDKDFVQDDLNEVLKKLYETNFFEDIKISFNNGELKIFVIENSIIENIEITGVKNKTFKKDILELLSSMATSFEDFVLPSAFSHLEHRLSGSSD